MAEDPWEEMRRTSRGEPIEPAPSEQEERLESLSTIELVKEALTVDLPRFVLEQFPLVDESEDSDKYVSFGAKERTLRDHTVVPGYRYELIVKDRRVSRVAFALILFAIILFGLLLKSFF